MKRITVQMCVWGLLGGGIVCFPGCVRYQYDLEMAVSDSDQMQRTLTVLGNAREPNAVPPKLLTDEDAQPLRQIYAGPAELVDDSDQRFSASFSGSLPQDIGGAGRIFRWETSLGSVVTYRERFRGSYDVQSMIEERTQAARRLCELFGAWAKQAASDSKIGAEIEEFANTTVKNDLVNAVLMVVLLESEERSGLEDLMDPQKGLPRLQQYLIEQGYLTDEMVPQFERGNQVDEQLTLAVSMLDLKRSGGNVPPLRDLIPALKDRTAFEASLNSFLVNTPEYQQLEEKHTPTKVLGILFMAMLGYPMNGGDILDIRVSSDQQPVETNGKWDAKEKQITWNSRLEIPGEPVSKMLPTFCYARWAYPNEEFQKNHFGRVMFRDSLLIEYVNWRMALTETEGAEWERFLAELTPALRLASQIVKFSFQNSETSVETRQHLTQQIRSMINTGEAAESE